MFLLNKSDLKKCKNTEKGVCGALKSKMGFLNYFFVEKIM